MKAWVLLEKIALKDNDKELKLYQRDAEFSIKVGNSELMNSRMHNSEDELARLGCCKFKNKLQPNILIGGLGMGFTLRVALNALKGKAKITIAELLPTVVEWNRSFLAHLAENPLEDNRVSVYVGDVLDKIKTARNCYDAILLDVDNGPQGLTQNQNNSLYSRKGLTCAYHALKWQGVLAIWSATSDAAFIGRLENVGFVVKETKVHLSSGNKKGGKAIIWIAEKIENKDKKW